MTSHQTDLFLWTAALSEGGTAIATFVWNSIDFISWHPQNLMVSHWSFSVESVKFKDWSLQDRIWRHQDRQASDYQEPDGGWYWVDGDDSDVGALVPHATEPLRKHLLLDWPGNGDEEYQCDWWEFNYTNWQPPDDCDFGLSQLWELDGKYRPKFKSVQIYAHSYLVE